MSSVKQVVDGLIGDAAVKIHDAAVRIQNSVLPRAKLNLSL
jgi:hypothetical protein